MLCHCATRSAWQQHDQALPQDGRAFHSGRVIRPRRTTDDIDRGLLETMLHIANPSVCVLIAWTDQEQSAMQSSYILRAGINFRINNLMAESSRTVPCSSNVNGDGGEQFTCNLPLRRLREISYLWRRAHPPDRNEVLEMWLGDVIACELNQLRVMKEATIAEPQRRITSRNRKEFEWLSRESCTSACAFEYTCKMRIHWTRIQTPKLDEASRPWWRCCGNRNFVSWMLMRRLQFK